VIGRVLFDVARASLDRAAFSDPAVHALELRRVFPPSWLFVGPANLVARPGDWLAARLGREPVILWRDRTGALKAFLNLCPRCERALGEGEHGSAARLACPSHPHETDLPRVAQLAVHRGLVFASLDPAALPFVEWLAPFANAFDSAFGSTMEAVGGHRLSWRFAGNWKLAMERFCGDTDGGCSAHAATDAARGRAIGGARDPGPAFTLFPNLSFEARTASLQVWQPVAPDRTEVDTWCLVAHDATPADREAARRATQFAWGPAGLLSQDLAVHWQSITETSKGVLARRHPLTLQEDPGQHAFYAWWQARLSAANERPDQPLTLNVRRTNPGEQRCASARSAAPA
jgi:phenylpropionate dioxygenase-like ring-hydroxylating dioxygenase large terminal subunit